METNYREIIILRGVPASGKSTYSNSLVNQGYKRLNKDYLRLMLNNYSLDNSDEDTVHQIQRDAIMQLMKKRRNIVIDNTHTKQKYITDLLKTIKNNQIDLHRGSVNVDYGVKIVNILVPLDVAIERNSKRESPVMEEVIRRMHEQLHSTDTTDKFFMIKDY